MPNSILIADLITLFRLDERLRPSAASSNWQSFGLLLAIALCVLVAAWLIARLRPTGQRPAVYSATRLFQELCSAHQLSRSERHLVHRLAQHYRLEDPALLFVEPAYFDLARLGAPWQHHQRALDSLRRRLYAQG